MATTLSRRSSAAGSRVCIRRSTPLLEPRRGDRPGRAAGKNTPTCWTQLPLMDELYRKRLELRRKRGAMEIESDEAKLVIDENGRCVDIVKRGRGTSECMIEEFMLLANQCAANAGRTNKVAFRLPRARSARCREDGKTLGHAAGLRAECQVQGPPSPTQLGTGRPAGRHPAGSPSRRRCTPASCAACRRRAMRPSRWGNYGPGPCGTMPTFTSPIRRYPRPGHPPYFERDAAGDPGGSDQPGVQ